jgi:hypothetical protein
MLRCFLVFFSLAAAINAQINFDDYFEYKSLRFDYFHTGNYEEEKFVFDEMKLEPFYGGSRSSLIDTFYFGNHFFKVFDSVSNTLIYSRGFSSLFQEWQSTLEAKEIYRSFEETIIMPFPKIKVKLEIFSRDKNRNNDFIKVFEHIIDPKDYFISQEHESTYETIKVLDSGDPGDKLDIVFIPEGYTAAELDSFVVKVKQLTDSLFNYEPFTSNKNRINVWAVLASSAESGADIPADSVWVNTVVNSTFYTFDSERYLMTTNMKAVRDVASHVPYDQIMILVNTDKYGGGAIYNYYSMTCANHPSSVRVFIHEFGHGFAGLADEYGDDPTYNDYYPKGVEPWEPNITTLADFNKKWKELVDADTPVPTPGDEEYHSVTGVFEGAGYVSKGVYRPTYDSIMRTLAGKNFNAVCRNAMEKLIRFYSE